MGNKYMRRGVVLLLAGIGLIIWGYYLMNSEIMKYGWAMIIGYIAFGFGFMHIIYSLMRKIDRKSLLEDRAVSANLKEEKEENDDSQSS